MKNWIVRAMGFAYPTAILAAVVFVLFRTGLDAIQIAKATALLIGFLAVATVAAWVWSFKLNERTRSALTAIAIYGTFIALIVVAWHPPDIWDVPFAKLTLGAIAENALKLLALFGAGWLLLRSL